MDSQKSVDTSKMRMIPLRDFIYLCVILAIVLIAIISYFLGNSSRAGELLNFGATAVSIVLAVIAIVMTIMDSSGQKQNVIQLKEVVDSIQENILELNEVTSNARIQFESIVDLKDKLMKQLNDNILIQRDLSGKLDKVIDSRDENEKVPVSELETIKDDLKLMQKELKILPIPQIRKIISSKSKRYSRGDSVHHEVHGNGNVDRVLLDEESGRIRVGVKFASGLNKVLSANSTLLKKTSSD